MWSISTFRRNRVSVNLNLQRCCIALLIAWLPMPLMADGELYFKPFVGIETSYNVSEEHYTEASSLLGVELEYFYSNWRLMVKGDYRYDHVYDIEDDFSQAAEEKYQNYSRVQHAYISTFIRDFDVSLGYQKIAWGEADDLRITDVVNPLDLKDFVLFDVNDLRIAQNMLRIEGPISDSWEIEAFWIFEFEANDIPPAGSEFAFSGVPDVYVDSPSKGEQGIRANTFVGDADLSLYLFNGYQDDPLYIFSDTEVTGEYFKERMLGTSMSFPLSNWVIRADAAYFSDRTFNNASYTGTLERDLVKAFLGADYLYQNWVFGMQVQDQMVLDYDSDMALPEQDTYLTSSIEGSNASAKLTTRVAITSSLSSGKGYLMQLKFTYKPNKDWEWRFFVDGLSGDDENFLGQFDDHDRLWGSVVYTF